MALRRSVGVIPAMCLRFHRPVYTRYSLSMLMKLLHGEELHFSWHTAHRFGCAASRLHGYIIAPFHGFTVWQFHGFPVSRFRTFTVYGLKGFTVARWRGFSVPLFHVEWLYDFMVTQCTVAQLHGSPLHGFTVTRCDGCTV